MQNLRILGFDFLDAQKIDGFPLEANRASEVSFKPIMAPQANKYEKYWFSPLWQPDKS